MPGMRLGAGWLRIACAVLVLIGFGACLLHADDETDDHGFRSHACATMLPVLSAIALTAPLAGPRVRIESSSSLRQALRRLPDPPPKVLALA
jgi:hypothetical protein